MPILFTENFDSGLTPGLWSVAGTALNATSPYARMYITSASGYTTMKDTQTARGGSEVLVDVTRYTADSQFTIGINVTGDPTPVTGNAAYSGAPAVNGNGIYVSWRYTGNAHLYVNGTLVSSNVTAGISSASARRVRIRYESGILYVRSWLVGNAEPGTWDSTTDLTGYTIADGVMAMQAFRFTGANADVRWDNVSVESLSSVTNVEFIAATAGSTAQAIEPTILTPVNVAVDLDTPTASAASYDPTIETEQLEALNVNFTSDYFHSSGTPSMGLGTLQVDGTNKTYFEVPVTNIPATAEVFARLYFTSAANLTIGVFQAVNYGTTTSNHTGTAYHTKDLTGVSGSQYVDIEITGAVQYAKTNGIPAQIALVRTAGTGSAAFHSNEGTNKPYARATWLPAPVVVDLTVDTATATLAGVEPTIDVVRSTEVLAETQTFSLAANDADLALGAAHDADSATLSTLANEPVVEAIISPDAIMDVATATASMATAEPTVSLPVSIDVSDTDTVMLGAYDVDVEITYNAAVNLEAALILTDRIPLTDVNGEPILRTETEDPYFNTTWETFSGQTYGVNRNYPAGIEQMKWFRFNEFDGDVVTSRTSAYYNAEDPYGNGAFDRINLVNVVKGLNEAPESRHSVYFNGDAYARQQHPTGLASSNDEQVFTPTSLEFTFRTERATQFLMGGADLMGGYTNVTPGPNWELWMVDGKIELRTHKYTKDQYGNVSGTEVAYRTTGFKNLADNQWHHIVVQVPSSFLDNFGASFSTEIYVDGSLEVRRRISGFVGGFPDWIGGRTENWYKQGEYNMYAAPIEKSYWFKGDLTELIYRNGRTLHVDEVTLQRDTMFGVQAIRPDVARVSFKTDDRVTIKGNRPRVLILDFGRPPTEGSGFQDPPYPNRMAPFTVPNQANVTAAKMEFYSPEWEGKKQVYFDFPGYGEAVPNVPSQQTGEYLWYTAHTYINRWAQNINNQRYNEFAPIISDPRETAGNYQYVDQVTDNYRLLDLEKDLNMDDYDIISIIDYPRTDYMWSIYDEIDGNNIEPKTPIRQQLERLMGQIRDQVVRNRKSLYVTDPFSAIALGIIDKAEYVPTFKESIRLDNRLGAYTDIFDWHSYIIDPFNGARPDTPRELRPDPREPLLYDSNRAAASRYKDFHANIKQRVRMIVQGLTTQPGWIKTDEIQWWSVNPMGNPPLHISRRYEDRSAGLDVGDEFYLEGGVEDVDSDFPPYWTNLRREHGWVAAPMSSIKVGAAVTSFANQFFVTWNHLDADGANDYEPGEWVYAHVDKAIGNPYGDHAVSIVVQPGDAWGGEQVSGKVYINFTEFQVHNPELKSGAAIMKWRQHFPNAHPSEVLELGEELTFTDGSKWRIELEHMRYNFSTHYGSVAGTEVALPDTGGSGADWGWGPGGSRGSTSTGGPAQAMQYHWRPATKPHHIPTPTMAERALKWLAQDLDVSGSAGVGVLTAEIEPVKVEADFTVTAAKNTEVNLNTARVSTDAHPDANTIEPDVTVLVGTASTTVNVGGLTEEIVLATATTTLAAREISPGEISYDWDATIVLTLPTQVETLILEEV